MKGLNVHKNNPSSQVTAGPTRRVEKGAGAFNTRWQSEGGVHPGPVYHWANTKKVKSTTN